MEVVHVKHLSLSWRTFEECAAASSAMIRAIVRSRRALQQVRSSARGSEVKMTEAAAGIANDNRSVIIHCCNHRYFVDAIKSVLHQTHDVVDLIVVSLTLYRPSVQVVTNTRRVAPSNSSIKDRALHGTPVCSQVRSKFLVFH